MTTSFMHLHGSPFERGLQQGQSQAHLRPAVTAAIQGRLAALGAALHDREIQAYLAQQHRFLSQYDPAGEQECEGLAQSYGLTREQVLAYLHANVVQDMTTASMPEADGCSAWAHSQGGQGCLVVKNRDYRGEHGALQRIFLHTDPRWPGRSMLCVGSLGSPGAFSSGMNNHGLAVVDTQISTRDHGVGWLRYFLMTALLQNCCDVAGALDMLAAQPHAGGGTLVLGDARGACAAVELGHARPPVITYSRVAVARTNHYLDAGMASDMIPKSDDLAVSSMGRLVQVQDFLAQHASQVSVTQAQGLMARHQTGASLCAHAGPTDLARSRTLSSVVYDCVHRRLHVSHGNPCEASWTEHQLSDTTITRAVRQ